MKVPICYACRTNRGLVDVTTLEDKSPVFTCTFCGGKSYGMDENRLVNGDLPTTSVGKVLGDFNSAISYAIRLFTSPLGKIRMLVSTNSNYCASITVDGVASRSLKRFIDEDFVPMEDVLDEWPDNPVQVAQTLAKIEHIMHSLQTTVNNVVELDLDA